MIAPLVLALAVASGASVQPAAAPASAQAPHPGLERIVTDTDEQRASWATRLATMARAGELRLRQQRPAPTPPQRDHWYVQLHKGVPVEGTEVWRRLDGTTLVADGVVYRDITVNPVPKLTRSEILEALAKLSPGTLGPSRGPDLVVLPTADGKYVLTYRARLFSGTALTTQYLDASTGAVVFTDEAPPMPGPAPR
jgi:hypothetical protein